MLLWVYSAAICFNLVCTYVLFRYGLVEEEEEIIQFMFKKKDDNKKLEQPEIKKFDKSSKLFVPGKDYQAQTELAK